MILSQLLSTQVLLEYDHSITLQKHSAALADKAKKDSTTKRDVTPDVLLQHIESGDPTPHKEYTQWMVKLYLTQPIKLEDLLSTVSGELGQYDMLKRKKSLPLEYRDINKIKTAVELSDVIRQGNDLLKSRAKAPDDKGQYEKIYSGPRLHVIKLLDETASKYFGRGTRWCTSGETNNMFNYYHNDGSIYVVLPKKPKELKEGWFEKYQLHPASRQCKDVFDDTYKFPRLIQDYPELIDVFKDNPDFEDVAVLHQSRDPEAQRKKEEQERQRQKEIDDLIASFRV